MKVRVSANGANGVTGPGVTGLKVKDNGAAQQGAIQPSPRLNILRPAGSDERRDHQVRTLPDCAFVMICVIETESYLVRTSIMRY